MTRSRLEVRDLAEYWRHPEDVDGLKEMYNSAKSCVSPC